MTFEELKPRFERLRDVVGNHSGALGDLAAIERAVMEATVQPAAVPRAAEPAPEEPVVAPVVTELASDEPPVKKRRSYKRRKK